MRTLSGATTGMAARIEKRDFEDSIAPEVQLTIEQKVAILKEVKASLERDAHDFPQFAESLLAKAEEIQLDIDNLSSDVPAGWIEPVADFPNEEPGFWAQQTKTSPLTPEQEAQNEALRAWNKKRYILASTWNDCDPREMI